MSALVASRIMPRTTLDIDASVLRELRRRGRHERKSMGRLASELLAGALARTDDGSPTHAFTWMSADLGTPRIDLEDKEAVQRILDERE
jgi:hypothetical protein